MKTTFALLAGLIAYGIAATAGLVSSAPIDMLITIARHILGA